MVEMTMRAITAGFQAPFSKKITHNAVGRSDRCEVVADTKFIAVKDNIR